MDGWLGIYVVFNEKFVVARPTVPSQTVFFAHLEPALLVALASACVH
jgi:hypothetical protein